MEIEKIFKEKTTIEIAVVKLENQKLTKSIFNQLRWYFPFDKDLNFKSGNIFGHVRIGEEIFGVGSANNQLFRFNTEYLRRFIGNSKLTLNYRFVDEDLDFVDLLGLDAINKIYKDENGYFDRDYVGTSHSVQDVITVEGQERLLNMHQNAKDFFTELLKRQIII